MSKNDLLTSFEKRKNKSKTKFKPNWNQLVHTDNFQKVYGFTCSHCHAYVSSDVVLSGVNNRNHCPYCLWSKHVDLLESGDRLAACKSPMHPIGLSLKKTRKKYNAGHGELMLIHLCTDCGHYSINRIAADDDNQNILSIFMESLQLAEPVKLRLQELGITLLTLEDRPLVYRQLMGQEISALEYLN